METRPPLPPFTLETAIQKVRLAEDAWNSRDPARIVLAYSPDTQWRNRAEFPRGRAEAQAFLERKWVRELDYRLIKELWAFDVTGAGEVKLPSAGEIAFRVCAARANALQAELSAAAHRTKEPSDRVAAWGAAVAAFILGGGVLAGLLHAMRLL